MIPRKTSRVLSAVFGILAVAFLVASIVFRPAPEPEDTGALLFLAAVLTTLALALLLMGSARFFWLGVAVPTSGAVILYGLAFRVAPPSWLEFGVFLLVVVISVVSLKKFVECELGRKRGSH